MKPELSIFEALPRAPITGPEASRRGAEAPGWSGRGGTGPPSPPGGARDQVADTRGAGDLREPSGIGVGALEHGELAPLEAQLTDPSGRVLDRLLRSLSRRRGRDDERGAGSGRRDEHPVLLLIARMEFVAADQSEQTGRFRHVRRIWRCLFA